MNWFHLQFLFFISLLISSMTNWKHIQFTSYRLNDDVMDSLLIIHFGVWDQCYALSSFGVWVKWTDKKQITYKMTFELRLLAEINHYHYRSLSKRSNWVVAFSEFKTRLNNVCRSFYSDDDRLLEFSLAENNYLDRKYFERRTSYRKYAIIEFILLWIIQIP